MTKTILLADDSVTIQKVVELTFMDQDYQVIAVSDGKAQSTLGPFSISVDAIVNGTATLSWQPPTQRTDGSVLDNLAGYHILWGSSPDAYTNRVTLDNPGLTSYLVENLAQGTWYFVMTAFDAAGAESDYSAVGSKIIQ